MTWLFSHQSIAARSNDEPCCDWVGEDGAGHYVKMVHNGIEYGDMQLICEAYHLMKSALDMTPDEMSEVSVSGEVQFIDNGLFISFSFYSDFFPPSNTFSYSFLSPFILLLHLYSSCVSQR